MNTDKPLLTTLVSNKEVVTVSATGNVTVITTRDRDKGKVETQIFYGRNPLVNRWCVSEINDLLAGTSTRSSKNCKPTIPLWRRR
jgi:hypothetical protein